MRIVCPAWNDGCDSEVCNGTKDEYVKGKCHSELYKAMRDGMLTKTELDAWVEYVKK